MVAGERLSFDSRQENEEIISLGVWRINMLKSMKKYVDDVRADLKRTETERATMDVAELSFCLKTEREQMHKTTAGTTPSSPA